MRGETPACLAYGQKFVELDLRYDFRAGRQRSQSSGRYLALQVTHRQGISITCHGAQILLREQIDKCLGPSAFQRIIKCRQVAPLGQKLSQAPHDRLFTDAEAQLGTIAGKCARYGSDCVLGPDECFHRFIFPFGGKQRLAAQGFDPPDKIRTVSVGGGACRRIGRG